MHRWMAGGEHGLGEPIYAGDLHGGLDAGMARTLSPRAAFRRRLMLLMAAFLVAGAAMAAQMARLGVVRADQSLAEAERRLYRQRWIPTVRGRILDRNGRVLAQNRPSYEVAIDYEVLSGEWAAERAREHARRVHGKAWPLLSAEQRETVVARFLPLYRAHVAAMEQRVQLVLGIDEATYAERRDRIIRRVERTAGSVADKRLEQYRQEQLDRGRPLTPEIEAVLQGRAEEPIAAQREAHALGDVPDETAFALIRMLDTFVTLRADEELLTAPDEAPRANVDPVALLPGLIVRRSEERQYPYDLVQVTLPRDSFPSVIVDDQPMTLELEGVAAHILGWMGDTPLATDTARRSDRLEADAALRERATVNTRPYAESPAWIDRGRYQPGDPVARSGVELSQETRLRGLRGLRIERLDTGGQQITDPEPGRDIRLTLDINLQARVQAILDPRFGLAMVHPFHAADPALLKVPVGTPLNGAAVVLDVDSGEVLALVTSPSYSRQILRERPEQLVEDRINDPLTNRAVSAFYPPGSIIKPLTLTGAVTNGNYRLGEQIECTGHLIPGQPDVLRCWIYRPIYGMTNHSARFGHDLNGVEAITASCNIFFYTMGRRMGPRGITQVLRDFGVGTPWNLGLGGAEFPGRIGAAYREEAKPGQEDVPEADREMERVYLNDGSDLTEFDATIMGMGQGPIAWTPLHAASAYATLARMGVAITPRLINDGTPPDVYETGFDRAGIAAALEGLDGVVNDSYQGTAHHITLDTGREPIFNTPGVHVWGKSGTAQAPPLYAEDPRTHSDAVPVREGEHAWFCVLVGREGDRPRFAICAIMEYGGSGSRVSGPIVNQIIRALIAEGYL